MNRLIITLLVTLCSFTLVSLTLDEAIEMGLANNHDIKITESLRKNADIDKIQAYAKLLPELSVKYNKGAQNDIEARGYGYEGRQNLFDGGKIYCGILEAGNNSKKSRNVETGTESSIKYTIEYLFYEALLKKTILEDAQTNLQHAQKEEEIAKVRFETGALSRTEYLNYSLNVSEKESDIIKYMNDYEQVHKELGFMIDLDDFVLEKSDLNSSDNEITRCISISKNEIDYRISQLIKAAEEKNHTILNTKLDVKSAKLKRLQAHLNFLPSLYVAGGKNWDKNENQSAYERSDYISVNLSMDVFPLLGKGGDLVKSKRNVNIAESNLEKTRRNLSIEISSEFNNLIAIAKRVISARIELDRAQELLDKSRVQLEENTISANDFLSSSIAYSNAKIRLENCYFDFLKTKSKLRYLVPTFNINEI